VKQIWCADNSSAVGSLSGVKKWWEYLQAKGLDFGYCLKPAKTILLIRDSRVILCEMNQKNGKVNPPSQIFLRFYKQMKLFMLIPKN